MLLEHGARASRLTGSVGGNVSYMMAFLACCSDPGPSSKFARVLASVNNTMFDFGRSHDSNASILDLVLQGRFGRVIGKNRSTVFQFSEGPFFPLIDIEEFAPA